MKYNIALIPSSDEIGHALITLANEISTGNSLEPDYLLKSTENLRIPHASVIQFEIEKNTLSPGMFGSDNESLLELIWKQVAETWREVLGDAQELMCTLPQIINYKHDTLGPFSDVSWAEF